MSNDASAINPLDLNKYYLNCPIHIKHSSDESPPGNPDRPVLDARRGVSAVLHTWGSACTVSESLDGLRLAVQGCAPRKRRRNRPFWEFGSARERGVHPNRREVAVSDSG